MGKHKIMHEGKAITFLLVRKKVKNVNLRIRSDSSIMVSANKNVPFEFIEQFVKSKAPWILKKIECRESRLNKESTGIYAGGETVYFLGQPYTLIVLPAVDGQRIELTDDELRLYVKNESDYSKKEELFYRWLKEKAETVFNDSLDRVLKRLAAYRIARPAVTIRTMKTRWGSCSCDKQKITLNTELIRAPVECIDYVVLHELAHFRHRKHDAGFYEFLSAVMPDWKKRKEQLKNGIAGRL